MIVSQGRAYILAATAARYAARPDADRDLIRPEHIAALSGPLTMEQRETVARSLTGWDALGGVHAALDDETWQPWQRLASALASDVAHPAAVVDVDDAVLRAVTTAAVRYALGRATYIVSEACADIRDMADGLGPACLAMLRTEIIAAASRRQLGWASDHRAWLDLASWLDTRLATTQGERDTDHS